MFNDMDQTRCPMLLYFLLYGCTWKKKKGTGLEAKKGSFNLDNGTTAYSHMFSATTSARPVMSPDFHH